MFARVCLVAGGLLLLAASLSFGSTEKRAGVRSGEIICADSSKGKVIRLNPNTGATHVLSKDDRFVDPGDLAFDGPNKLYVADYGAFGGTGGVFKVNPSTGKTTVVSDDVQFEQPDGIAVAPNGKLWVTDLDAFGGAVFRVNPQNGDTDLIASEGDESALEDAIGVEVPKNGKPLVSSYSEPALIRINPDNGATQILADSGDGLEASSGFALHKGKAYFPEGSKLQSVTLRTTKVNTAIPHFKTDSYNPAVDPKGRIYQGFNDKVIRGNPKNNDVDAVGSGFGFCEGAEYAP
jgi:streptogramin lyase